MSATEKYKNVSVEDKDQFENYITDITNAYVTIEEIPILSTLENIKIVLFSSRGPDPVLTVNPNTKIVGNYQYEKSKEEVVLFVEGNPFSRMEPVVEDSEPKSDKHIIEKEQDKTTEELIESTTYIKRYKKGGNAGSKSIEFQVNLLVVLMLNSLRKLRDWELSTENLEAGKFDDAVLKWSEGTILIQAKHRESRTKKITFEDLMSTNTKDDFSLPKYFLSHQEIKHIFKSAKNAIICTNATFHEDITQYLDIKIINSDNMLYCADDDYSFYTFNKNILPRLKENLKIYLEKNCQNKNVDETVISEENLKDFLEQMQFYSNYSIESNKEKVVEQLLPLAKYQQISFSELYTKIMDWFKQKDPVCLNEVIANAMFSEIYRDKHWQRLQKYNMSFKENKLNFQAEMKIYHIIPAGGHMQELKIYHTLKNNIQYLYAGSDDDDVEGKKQAIDAFQLSSYILLVIIGPTIAEESVISEISDKLRKIIDEDMNKKIILVTIN